MQIAYKLLRIAYIVIRNLRYVCGGNFNPCSQMDTYVIIAVIVASVLATAAIAMVILLLYYHWRNRELLTNFSAFIRENLKLKDEIGRLQEENSELNEELNKTK